LNNYFKLTKTFSFKKCKLHFKIAIFYSVVVVAFIVVAIDWHAVRARCQNVASNGKSSWTLPLPALRC